MRAFILTLIFGLLPWQVLAGEKVTQETTFTRAIDTVDHEDASEESNGVDDPDYWADTFFEVNFLAEEVVMVGYRPLGCNIEETVPAFGATVHKADINTFFYLVPCHMGDVNVEHYVAQIGPRHEGYAEYYDFEYPPDFNLDNRSLIVNPEWWNDESLLTSVEYYSPDADCGVYQIHRYDWADDFFELIEYREKPECDGIHTAPTDYPLVWTIEEMGQ